MATPRTVARRAAPEFTLEGELLLLSFVEIRRKEFGDRAAADAGVEILQQRKTLRRLRCRLPAPTLATRQRRRGEDESRHRSTARDHRDRHLRAGETDLGAASATQGLTYRHTTGARTPGAPGASHLHRVSWFVRRRAVDHRLRGHAHAFEEPRAVLTRHRAVVHRFGHARHPGVCGTLIDGEGQMPCT